VSPIPFDIDFGEPVTGFAPPTQPGDLVLTNGTLVDFNDNGGGLFSITVTPGANGTVTVSVNAGICTDLAGNPNEAATPFDIEFDSDRPTVTLTSTAGVSGGHTNASPIPMAVQFSEPVTGFDPVTEPSDVNVTNGTLDNFIDLLDGRNYSFDVTPDAEGLVTVAVPEGAARDAALNDNFANAFNITYDSTPPTAIITLVTTSPTGADTVEFEVAFDEAVAPTFDGTDVSVTGTLVGPVGGHGPDPAYTVTVALTDPDADGTVGIEVAGGGAVTDLAGNPYAGGASPLCEVFNWHGFISGPENTQAYTGDPVMFTVVPDCGASTLAYQWKREDGLKTIQDGPNTASWELTSVTPANAGDYWCEVTYDGETHPSAVGALDVADPISITEQPQSASKYVGDSHAFSIGATGGFGTLHYEWLHDGYTVGDDSPLLEIVSLTLGDAGAYSCEVTDEGPAAPLVSDEAILDVTVGAPAAGLVGLGVLVAACALGAIGVLRRRR